jgi:hypothetical protein
LNKLLIFEAKALAKLLETKVEGVLTYDAKVYIFHLLDLIPTYSLVREGLSHYVRARFGDALLKRLLKLEFEIANRGQMALHC